MSYSFRVKFRLDAPRIQSDQTELVLASPVSDGEAVQVVPLSPDGVLMKDATTFALVGSDYTTESAAQEAGERWRGRVEVAFARIGVGADFGDRAPTGGASDYTKARAAEHGIQLINDAPGVIVFQSEPPPIFTSGTARMHTVVAADRVTQAITIADRNDVKLSERERLAYNLYSASFFQDEIDSRFLLLMMALETLIEQQAQDVDVIAHVDRLIDETADSGLSPVQIAPLVRALENLRRESIGQAGRELARALGQRIYMSMTAIEFFTHCYDVRGDLVHGADPRPSREIVNQAAAHLERFVGHVIGRRLLDHMLD